MYNILYIWFSKCIIYPLHILIHIYLLYYIYIICRTICVIRKISEGSEFIHTYVKKYHVSYTSKHGVHTW